MSAPLTKEQWLAVRRASQDAILSGDIEDLLLRYQQRTDALLESASVIVIEKSRRIGLTFGLAASAVLKAARKKSEGGMDALYISYSREMTREFIDACGMWARVFSLAAADEEEFLFDDTDETDPTDTRKIQAFRILFASGFEIVGLSSAPRALRGKQGLCIIDEAAFVDSLKALMKSALAFLMWGGQVCVVSTHNGTSNYFNELIQEVLAGRKSYKHLKIDLDDALRDGLYQRICQVQGVEWTAEAEAQWREDLISDYGDDADEELFCIPAEGDGVWLPSTLIEARMTAEGEILRFDLPADFLQLDYGVRTGMLAAHYAKLDTAIARLDPEELYGLGFDFARHIDLSVATLLGMDKSLRRRERLCIELRRWPYREQAELLTYLIKRLRRWQAAIFDATGSGEAVAEDVQRACGEKIVSLKLSSEWYRLNMPFLKRAFEDDSISLIPDREHREDLRIVRIVRGIPQVPDIRVGDGKGGKRHGDFAVSLALAEASLRTELAIMAYQPVPTASHPMFGDSRGRRDWRYPDHDDDRRMPEGSLRGSIY